MGKRAPHLKDRSHTAVRTPALNSPAWRPLDMDGFGPSTFFGKRKKRLDPGDFVAIKDGFTTVDICHGKCAHRAIAIMSEAWELPKETWTTSSLKTHDGKDGVPIKHDLHCSFCPPGWEYEEKTA